MSGATERLAATLGLLPHPEGGHYRETYRATETTDAGALPERFGGARSHSTAIYFLLAAGERSKLHRIRSDEVWHLYDGGPLLIISISPAGDLTRTMLGRNLAAGEVPQHVVAAGHWFGALPADGASHALCGCTVAPGFDFNDFELARRDALLAAFPGHRHWILQLTD